MKILRIEPFSGIAGDMFAAAGAPLAGVREELEGLPGRLGLPAVEVRFEEALRGGVRATRFQVLKEGRSAEETAAGSHTHLTDLLATVDGADLPPGVRARSRDLLLRLGRAEAEIHGVPLERVHLHEAGAVDSLVDLVAAAWIIDRLAPDAVLCEPVCVGFGTVSTAHGLLPVPAPATELLLRDMPVVPGSVEGEMTTPTGAAILAHLEPEFTRRSLTVEQAAYGAGSRETPGRPNVLRLSSGATAAATEGEELILLETSVDDMSGELVGSHLLTALLDRGALDALLRPVVMKKGRPGVQIEVLCRPPERPELTAWLLENTTTLGVRWHVVHRLALAREVVEVSTPFGTVRVKKVELPSGRSRGIPEFEDCRTRAEEAGVPLLEVYRAALINGSD